MMICIVTNLIMMVPIKILYNLQRNPMKSTNKDTMRRVDERRTWWHKYYDYGDGVCDVYDYNVDNDDYGDHVA